MEALEIAIIVIQVLCTVLVTVVLFVASSAHAKGTEVDRRLRKVEIQIAKIMGELRIPFQIESD